MKTYNDIPLVVDLDGTLMYTDLLFEGILVAIKKNPFYIFFCFFWLLKGKVYFKNKIFEHGKIAYNMLPWNQELLRFLEVEAKNGRQIVLATASIQAHAKEISKVTSIFDEIYATENINLKGKNKLEILLNNYGEAGFDYIGDSNSDLVIFSKSRNSYLVNPSRSLEKKAKKISNIDPTLKSRF